jgi:hypothetical protein
MIQRIVTHRCLLLSLLVAGLLWSTGAWAVTPQDTALPFDQMGANVYSSAKNVWVPLIVFGGLVALAGVFIAGSRSLAGHSIRTIIAIGILAVACTGVGLAVLFPGLVTACVLP